MALAALVLLGLAFPAWAQEDYARFGLALKSGAAAGPMGIQLSWNLSEHVQVGGGGGGEADFLSILDRNRAVDRTRTDSYFLLGRYFLRHLFFETGYSLKVTKAENVSREKVRIESRPEQGLPMLIGYEFGRRRGFFFSASAGFLYVFGGGGKVVSPDIDADPGTSATSAASTPTAGLSVGYYLW